MDWNVLISGVIGLLAGGGVGWIFVLRESKAGSKADVVDKSTEAMNKMMGFIGTQQDEFNKIIASKDDIIRQQSEVITEFKNALDKAKYNIDEHIKKIKEYEYKATERDRKIDGMQKVLTKEVGKKKFAESRICLVEGCDLRKPDIDTFNSDEK